MRFNSGVFKTEKIVFVLSICLFGLFHEGSAGYVGVVLLILIAMRIKTEHKLILPKSVFLLTLSCIPLVALVGSLWAVDCGLALIGVAKWFPIPMFIILTGYDSPEDRSSLLRTVPYVSAALTLSCGLLYFTPLKDTIFVNDRMMGTFQYANSFALLLMIGVMISLFEEKKGLKELLLIIVNIVGIILTGCRAVFCLLIIGIISWIVYEIVCHRSSSQKSGKFILAVTGSFGVLLILGMTLAEITGKTRLFARFTQFYIHSSTFIGRYLYLIDGLKMLFKHPLGMGYKGYLFIQGSMQSANYSVTFAHNELLQAGLDYGIAVMLLLLVGYAIVLFKKSISFRDRLILILTGIHLLFDWDAQFVALVFIIVLLMDCEWDKIIVIEKGIMPSTAIAGFLSLLVLWTGTAANLEAFSKYESAARLFPGMTMSQMNLINSSEDKYEMAENICKRNDYCTIALQAMAEKALKSGDLVDMEKYADKALRSAKYNSDGYKIYIEFMYYAVQLCEQAGEREAELYFLSKISEAETIIDGVEKNTHRLAKYLNDSPGIKLPDDYLIFIDKVTATLVN